MLATSIEVTPFERTLANQAWARWLARSIDIFLLVPVLMALYLGLGLAVELGRLPADFTAWMYDPLLSAVVDTVVLLILVALWDPLFLSNTGTTPGKWIMGVRVRRLDEQRVGFFTALARALWVFTVGLGLLIPMVSLICMVSARSQLVRDRRTSWDKVLKLEVPHSKRHPIFWLLAIAGVVAMNIVAAAALVTST